MATQGDKNLSKWFNDKMTDTTVSAFGDNYLDTTHNKSQHIRNLLKVGMQLFMVMICLNINKIDNFMNIINYMKNI